MRALLVLVGLGLAVPAATADAGSSKKSSTVKVCKETKDKRGRTKRKCRYEQQFQGYGVKKAALRTEPLARPSGEVWVRSENLREEVNVQIYAADGSFDEAALAQLDEVFRCKRSGEVRAVDPRLYEQLSRIYDHFGKQRIELVSGFRNQERTSSRHWHASAMDIRIKGVSNRKVFDFAESLDMGGMGVGIYPNSGFVHVDFRAPGDSSYRWTDWSYPDGDGKASASKPTQRKRGKDAPRTTRARKPTS
jgi:uncharacterized protein YcbK (DUF882 family)